MTVEGWGEEARKEEGEETMAGTTEEVEPHVPVPPPPPPPPGHLSSLLVHLSISWKVWLASACLFVCLDTVTGKGRWRRKILA